MKSLSSFLGILVLAAFTHGQSARQLLDEHGVKGGLVVHVGCGDGKLTADIAKAAKVVVHGLDANADKIAKARRLFHSSTAATRLSAEHWTATKLPHAGNLVNLLLVDEGAHVPSAESIRVLAPGGTVLYRHDGRWMAKNKKAGSANRDWTHYQFDAANNPVGQDPDCGLPRRFQWSGKPLWSAAHESMASLNAMVSTKGRVFYIIDEGPRASIQLPADWQLVARDAHNGVVLWKKPIKRWLTRFWPWKSGPAQMPRKLIAVGDHVYAPLDINGPLKQFDAATGKEIRTYAGTAAADEVIHTDGILLIQVNPTPPDMDTLEKDVRQRRHFSYDGRNRAIMDHDNPKSIVAVEAATGKQLWKHDAPKISPLSLSALKNNVVYHNGSELVCLNLRSGKQNWKSEPIAQQRKKLIMNAEESATVVLHEKAVFYARNRKLTTVSMKDGKTLWKTAWVTDDYRSPVSVMLMHDLVWSMNITGARAPGTFIGRDILTGEEKQKFDLPPFKGIGHHRCYKAKASGDYVLLSRSGVEYVDPRKESYDENHWIRGACLFGILPANGMLYSTPHACACYIKGKLNGFTAMSPESPVPVKADYTKAPQQKGGVYPADPIAGAKLGDWPTYRQNFTRNGQSTTQVSSSLQRSWKTKLGGDLTSVTIANGLVFVSQKDRNTVHALNAKNGSPVWQFTAGGMVDSPPTISDGHAYFGSADGNVYCLRASDGKLAWRTRAAPAERRVVGYGRVESAWPVHGSVLVQKRAVYASAGRSSFLDGGIYVVKIDAVTGKVLYNYNVHDLETGQQPPLTSSFDMAGALPDILSGDGERVFMRHLGFDAETLSPREKGTHVFSPAGYLDDTWWHRIYWVYGDDTQAGYGGWWKAGNKLPAGRLMVYDEDSVYTFGRSFYAGMNSAQFGRGEKYVLAASAKSAGMEPDYNKLNQQRRLLGDLKLDWKAARTTPTKWSEEIPFHVRAMALAGKTLFAAGPYGDAVRSMDSFTGSRGVRLGAVDTTSGKLISSYEIGALPVWDGLAAAHGRLFAAMNDGTVHAFGAEGTKLESTLGEAVEVLPEKLLGSDEEYRKMVREATGYQQGGGKRRTLRGRSLNQQFTSVTGGKVIKSDLGYRFGANENAVALALNKLDQPITSTATWTFKIRAAAGFPNPPYYQNGFFAFGDSTEDAKLVKCGIQFVRGTARIIKSQTNKQSGKTEKLANVKKSFDVTVSVDLKKRTVTMKVAGKTLTEKLPASLKRISQVGFVSWNAVTDFSKHERTD